MGEVEVSEIPAHKRREKLFFPVSFNAEIKPTLATMIHEIRFSKCLILKGKNDVAGQSTAKKKGCRR